MFFGFKKDFAVPWLCFNVGSIMTSHCEFERRVASIEGIVDFVEYNVLVVAVVCVSGETVRPPCVSLSNYPVLMGLPQRFSSILSRTHPRTNILAAVVAALSNTFQAIPGSP